MPRAGRERSASDVYHLIARGAAKQLIFEDDQDRRHFISLLSKGARAHDVEVLAYCLMENHVHLLVRVQFDELSPFCRELLGRYAAWFNGRYERCGHLFQGRFQSEPVNDDGYLLAVIRYIHKNPERARLCSTEEWRWSSYQEYLGKPCLVFTSLALEMLEGVEGFKEFHRVCEPDISTIDVRSRRNRMDDGEAKVLADRLLGSGRAGSLKAEPWRDRNEALKLLKKNGIGVRQIQRLTGISLAVISKA